MRDSTKRGVHSAHLAPIAVGVNQGINVCKAKIITMQFKNKYGRLTEHFHTASFIIIAGGQSQFQVLRAQGRNQLWIEPHFITGTLSCMHAYTYWDSLDMPINLRCSF